MTAEQREAVFVPSVLTADGALEGLGIYSTEAKALEVLRDTLRERIAEGLKEAQLVLWELDAADSEAIPLKHMLANLCPVCRQRTFWTDAIEMSALCYLSSCQAWIEDSDIEEDRVDCGWPPIGFTSQSESLAEALSVLRIYGAKIRGSGELAPAEEAEEMLQHFETGQSDPTSIREP